EVPDEEYQAWAAEVFQPSDQDAIERGRALSCVLCNLLTKTVLDTHRLNKKKPLHERFDQDQTQEVLIDFCSDLAKPIARQMDVIEKDVLMVCNRVVKENVGDMMDVSSVELPLKARCGPSGRGGVFGRGGGRLLRRAEALRPVLPRYGEDAKDDVGTGDEGQEGSRALDAYGFLLAHAELENEELSFWGNVRGAAQLAFLRQGGSVHVSPSAFFEKNTLRPSSAVRTVRGPVVVVAEPSHDPSHRERFLRGS
ncbi:unnamed protein product, partial [Durusdinium trenchii]